MDIFYSNSYKFYIILLFSQYTISPTNEILVRGDMEKINPGWQTESSGGGVDV